jgi:hypothetical protein
MKLEDGRPKTGVCKSNLDIKSMNRTIYRPASVRADLAASKVEEAGSMKLEDGRRKTEDWSM